MKREKLDMKTLMLVAMAVLVTIDAKTWLSTKFSGHRHLIFVTHSAGGLIVEGPTICRS